MKRFALPALLVAVAFFGISSTASAGHGHFYGHRGHGPSFGPGGYYNQGYHPHVRSYRYSHPRQFNNFRYNSFRNRHHGYRHHGFYNRGGLRLRSGGISFGLRF